jgi:hypothetical protein
MNESTERVVVTDLRIPFIRLVLFFVKAALAAIPAAIILSFLAMLVGSILMVALGLGDGSSFMMRRWTF